MARKISFGLSAREVRGAKKRLLLYKEEFINKTRLFAEKLAEEGVYIAQMNLVYHDAIDTSELMSSIAKEPRGTSKTGSTWVVYTDCPYAKYIEFGFGVVGSGSPHPDTSILGWKYDANEHGDSGWMYKGRDGEWHWSKGQPSKPFMYETGKELGASVVRIAREVFGSD